VSIKRGLALAAGLLLLFFVLLKESREPYLWLHVEDLLHAKPPPVTLPLIDRLATRVYPDTRPHTGKVARLQKGLVLVEGYDASQPGEGQERIEEGFGFGLPLVEVAEKAYLSRSATVERKGNRLVKRYVLDTLDTPSGFLRRKYEPVPPIGTVTVTYTISAGDILVAVDLSDLESAWNRVYLMNEQGARFFTGYEEPGLFVEGEEFGRWQPTIASRGCVVAGDRSVRFCVETDQPLRRYFGRERYNQYYWLGVYPLSWAGIDLELEPPVSQFEYRISVERPELGE
jgi:hypothetical protein